MGAMDMKNKTYQILMILVVITVFVVALYAYTSLPDDGRYPVHWSFTGEPDRYGSKFELISIGPIVTGLLYGMAMVLPRLDPKKLNYSKFQQEYMLIMLMIILAIAAVYFISIAVAFGIGIKVDVWVQAVIGLMIMILGNYMSRLKQSWFVGIKTPWTLSNEKVWEKTHRYGGRVFVVMGLIMVLNAFIGIMTNKFIFMAVMIGLPLSTVVYSYVIYKKIDQGGSKH
jgi:uncharacterized membrane protein